MIDFPQELWFQAQHHPLFNQLVSPESYIFSYVTKNGFKEEIADESRHLSDVYFTKLIYIILIFLVAG